MNWALIYSYQSVTTVNNTVFTNISSNYSSAIFAEEYKLNVSNSKFINLDADKTAVLGGSLNVLNSNFSNNSAAMAIYLQWMPINLGIGPIITWVVIAIIFAIVFWFGFFIYYALLARNMNKKIELSK